MRVRTRRTVRRSGARRGALSRELRQRLRWASGEASARSCVTAGCPHWRLPFWLARGEDASGADGGGKDVTLELLFF